MKDAPQELPVDRIDPNPHQPRKVFPEKAQRELMESIRLNGLIQPIVVRAAGERYQVVAGERRLRAVTELGMPTIAVVVKDVDDEEMRSLALLENIQREDLSAVETARSIQALIQGSGYTQEQVAGRVGKDRSTVANLLRLLELPAEIQDDVMKKRLGASHARALLALKDPARMLALRDKLAGRDVSVREVERLVKKAARGGEGRGRPAPPPPPAAAKDPHARELEEKLAFHLSTRVEIWGSREGSIQIHFADPTEFNRIFNRLLESGADEE